MCGGALQCNCDREQTRRLLSVSRWWIWLPVSSSRVLSQMPRRTKRSAILKDFREQSWKHIHVDHVYLCVVLDLRPFQAKIFVFSIQPKTLFGTLICELGTILPDFFAGMVPPRGRAHVQGEGVRRSHASNQGDVCGAWRWRVPRHCSFDCARASG